METYGQPTVTTQMTTMSFSCKIRPSSYKRQLVQVNYSVQMPIVQIYKVMSPGGSEKLLRKCKETHTHVSINLRITGGRTKEKKSYNTCMRGIW